MSKRIPSSAAIDNWLKIRFPGIRKVNDSGCPYIKGIPDYHAKGIASGWIEVKRGNEEITDDQEFWLIRLDGFVYRFWSDHVQVQKYVCGELRDFVRIEL